MRERSAPKPVAVIAIVIAIVIVIAIDGPGDAMVVHHGITSRRMRVTFDGPGGHLWAD